jgi:hypothetical protein
MIQSYPLDDVIRKVSEPIKEPSSAQKLVTIDKKTGKSLEKAFFKQFLKDTEYYLVSSRTQADYKFIYNDRVFGTGSFSLVIETQVSCDIENAEKIAEALCLETHPGVKLEQEITKYVGEFIRKHREEFLNNFPQAITKLTSFIVENVQKKILLAIDVQISLDGSKLKPYIIETQHFLILVKDCNEELDLKLRAELIVDPKNKIKAISNYEKRNGLNELVKESIKNYLHSNVSLQEFSYGLKTIVYEKIKNDLNSVLANYGFQVRVLSIGTNSVPPVEFFEIESDIKYKLQDYSEAITVKNRLQLKPSDIAIYKLADSPSLESWSKKQLSVIIPQVLFQKHYTDILYDFEKIAEEIKEQLEVESEKIGYRVDHIISVAELREKELTREFILTEEEGTFATKDARVKVKLNTIVRAKIERLELIKDYLSKKVDVAELKKYMNDSIRDTISEFLHDVEPERYYLRFDTKDEKNYQKEDKTVTEELKYRIQNKLSQEFHATVISVVIKYLDTEVSQRYEELYEEGSPFEIEIESLQDAGEIIKFRGHLQVTGVDKFNWATFQSRKATLEDIKQYFLDSLKPKLKTFRTSSLAITDADELIAMQDFVNKCANQALVEQYLVGRQEQVKSSQGKH